MRCILFESDEGFLEWVREKAEFEGKFDQEMSFLRERLHRLEGEKEEMWEKGFRMAKKLGRMEKRVEFDDVGLFLTKERPYQLIVTEKPSGLDAVIKKIDGMF